MGTERHPLDIPPFLKRDADNQSEYMKMASTAVSDAPEAPKGRTKAPAKANGHVKAPVKAADKPKAVKVAKAAPKVKAAAKAPEKAPKAKTKEVTEKDAFGFRLGSAKSKAVALYSRKNGATLAEVKDELGSVQLNVLVALEAEGHKVERVKEEREGARSVTRYILKPKK